MIWIKVFVAGLEWRGDYECKTMRYKEVKSICLIMTHLSTQFQVLFEYIPVASVQAKFFPSVEPIVGSSIRWISTPSVPRISAIANRAATPGKRGAEPSPTIRSRRVPDDWNTSGCGRLGFLFPTLQEDPAGAEEEGREGRVGEENDGYGKRNKMIKRVWRWRADEIIKSKIKFRFRHWIKPPLYMSI